MNTYYYFFEVEPLPDNPTAAHASRAVAHIWVQEEEIHQASEKARNFLTSERWIIQKEQAGSVRTAEQAEALGAEELANYQAAQEKGFHSVFYYWHRTD